MYPFIAITPRSTLTECSSTCWDPINRSNRSVSKIFILDKNTWYHITVQIDGLVSLFYWHINLCRLFNASCLEEQLWYYLTHSWEDKGVHTFPKGICPKVNVIARLDFQLTYYDSEVHRFNHYTTRTPPVQIELFKNYSYLIGEGIKI